MADTETAEITRDAATPLYPGVLVHIVHIRGSDTPAVKKKVLRNNATRLSNLPF